jgi:hypothetical protein
MSLRSEAGIPRRRRWPRERVRFTVLGHFEDRECLGRTIDLGDGGLCAVFQGRDYSVGKVVEVHLVAGDAVRRLFGAVAFAVPHGRNTRVGIRTRGFAPVAGWDRATELPAGYRGWRRGPGTPHQEIRWEPSVSVNLGFYFNLVSPQGRQAMARDRHELIRDIQELYGAGATEPWETVLRRFLHQLPRSPLRSHFVREQFRAEMYMGYPASRGSEIRGRIIPSGTGFSPGRLPQCIIQLDQFAVASSDHRGCFVARGIPSIDEPITVPVRIANHAVLFTQPVAVHLPRARATCIEIDLHISLRALRRPGRRPDQKNSGIPGPRGLVAGGTHRDSLEELRQLVEEL